MHRLTPIEEKVLPWRKAEQLTRAHLYWLPVRAFPIPGAERAWLMQFLDRFIARIAEKQQMRVELFLQMKALYPNLMDDFSRTAPQFGPLIGLARRPQAPITAPPSEKEIEDLVSGRKKFNFKQGLPDYAYWFTRKNERPQREAFLGEGGLSLVFLAPDPATKAPPLPFTPAMRKNPIFKQFDIDALHEQTFALTDGFQEKSKKLLGADLTNHPQFPGIRFILPLVRSQDFFQQPETDVKKWFDMYPIIVQESPDDNGVLLASRRDLDLDDELESIVQEMRNSNVHYPA
jgi:hypothetical protein